MAEILEAERKHLEENVRTLGGAIEARDEATRGIALGELTLAMSKLRQEKIRLQIELDTLQRILRGTKRNLKFVATCEASSPKEKRLAIEALKKADVERIEQQRVARITLEAKARAKRLRWGP